MPEKILTIGFFRSLRHRKELEDPPAARTCRRAQAPEQELAGEAGHWSFLAVLARSVKPAMTTLVRMATTEPWTPSSWRSLPALQQPEWPDPGAVDAVRERLGQLAPLVFAGDARELQRSR